MTWILALFYLKSDSQCHSWIWNIFLKSLKKCIITKTQTNDILKTSFCPFCPWKRFWMSYKLFVDYKGLFSCFKKHIRTNRYNRKHPIFFLCGSFCPWEKTLHVAESPLKTKKVVFEEMLHHKQTNRCHWKHTTFALLSGILRDRINSSS